MDDEQALKIASGKIAEFLDVAYGAIREAQVLADQYGISFYFATAYGMGGDYEPNEGWTSSSEDC